MPARASIVIPTRDRPSYLEVTLASLQAQAAAAGVEVVVVDDSGAEQSARPACERHGARHVPHLRPLGLNAARNSGIQASTGDLIIFIDDDVVVHDGWLHALIAAAETHPEVDVLTGPIAALLEGDPPRSCGRERPPITSLDLGPDDGRTRFAWGVNMAIRRSAVDRVGHFDPSLGGAGDEQEWQERLQAAGGHSALYVAGASLTHRRAPEDARLLALARSCYGRGRASRRFDARRQATPSRSRELMTLLACAGHVLRYRCPNGLTMLAHSAGRLAEALAERASERRARAVRSADAASSAGARRIAPAREPSATDRRGIEHGSERAEGEKGRARASASSDFLSGESGTVGGLDRLRRRLADGCSDAAEIASGRRRRLAAAASLKPPVRSVLALSVVREQHRALAGAIGAELLRSRHDVQLQTAPPGRRGRFENLNALLERHPADGHDWLLLIDDDVVLGAGFLDRFLFLADRFRLDLAQPAHRSASHAAWNVTRRRPLSLVRETRFVEIGPVAAFSRRTFSELLPFPPLRMGWGLDLHWAALAQRHGWRCGVTDAVSILHSAAPAAAAYSRREAIEEARAFLAERPFLTAEHAKQTLRTHRRL